MLASLITEYSCIFRESFLSNELEDVMMDLTRATHKTSELSKANAEKKSAVRESYDSDSSEYDELMEEIQDQYECDLAKITDWETELNSKKNMIDLEMAQASETKKTAEANFKNSSASALSFGGPSS